MVIFRVAESTLYLEGELVLREIAAAHTESAKLYRNRKLTQIDPSGVTAIDSAGVAFWEDLIVQLTKNNTITILPAQTNVQKVMDTFRSLDTTPEVYPKQTGYFERLGDKALLTWSGFMAALFLASEIFHWSLVALWNRRSQRKGAFTQQCIILGQNAVLIVGLLSFIIGLILSLQAAVQMRNFGAGMFLADVLAFTMVRELAPLITAIVVSGRSGSAIASEIASMQVSEELDALRMMALHPIRYVVVPKFHALTFMMLILVGFAILFGELGGALVALTYLDISPVNFFNRSLEVLTLTDFAITFVKSIVFAWLIVVIGSYYGFRVTGGSEGVGKATTSSVVTSIFTVIVVDALFSLLYL